MAIEHRAPPTSLLREYLRRRLIPVMESYNIETIPDLEQFPRNMGSFVPFSHPPGSTLLPIKRLMSFISLSDMMFDTTMHKFPIIEKIIDNAKTERGKWGNIHRSRNYYIISSLNVGSEAHYAQCETVLWWSILWVVMPRKWRRRRWEARCSGQS